MLTAPWTKTIREADEIALINGIEYRDDSVLEDFVLQRRDGQRELPIFPTSLWDGLRFYIPSTP